MSEKPADVMLQAIGQLEATLTRLIPIPNRFTHDVALALDVLIHDAKAALEEMS